MKLRIRGNSIRLRLTQSEVARLVTNGRVEETIEFGPAPHQRLTYALEAAPDAAFIAAAYQANRITVRLPSEQARAWASDASHISLNGEQTISFPDESNAPTLKLLIEKDFACLTEHRGADDADTFPHPLEGTMRC